MEGFRTLLGVPFRGRWHQGQCSFPLELEEGLVRFGFWVWADGILRDYVPEIADLAWRQHFRMFFLSSPEALEALCEVSD